MTKKKLKISNEKLFEEIKKLQEQFEQNRQIVPFIVQPAPVVVYPNNHSHCTCQLCHPSQWFNPLITYGIGGTTGTTYTATGTLTLNSGGKNNG